MKINQSLFISSLALATILALPPAPAAAGGYFGLHIGTGGFGVSVGVGDWGPYTNSWSDPQWSLSFSTALAGYGEWVRIDGLGRCWRPWVAAGWRPYTHGRWVRTGLSLTWVAYEPWGYIPHHYGSWAHASYGWVWVPGYTYASANVTWVRGGGHIGWYARPPYGWSHSSRAFHRGYQHGYRDGWNDARYGTYVGWQHFGSDNVSHHAVTHTVASKTRLTHGGAVPASDELWRKGRSKVTASRVSTRTARIDGREIVLARPEGVASSIERNASSTVRNALSESAHRLRQPQVTSRQSGNSRSTGADVPRSRVQQPDRADSRGYSPSSAGRRAESKGSLSQPVLRSRPSHSKSRSTAVSSRRSETVRNNEVRRATTAARKTDRSRAATSNRTRSATTQPADPRRSMGGKTSGEQSTAQRRTPQSRVRSTKTGSERSKAGSQKKNAERPKRIRRR